MIIGREREIEELLKYLHSNKAELVAVYGRRRVGKTFLVREVFKNKFFFYCTGSQKINTVAEQLERFADAMVQSGLSLAQTPESWMQAFDMLRDAIKSSKSKERKVIFIDEMPWFDLPDSGFIAAFEYFWNAFASARTDILCIVCGSATSWITKKLFRDRGGLHNRVTGKINLRPFTLQECEQYFQAKGGGYERYDLIECYMVLGGIPYYLDFIDKRYSLAINIDRMFFAENAALANEFEELYASLFDNPGRHLDVVAALSKKKKGLTRDEIVDTTKLTNGGSLSEILKDLELSGFVRRYNAYPKKANGSLYQLVDNFSLFWFEFLEKNRPTNAHFWSGMRNTPKLNAWRGYAFEMVCLKHIDQVEQGLGVSGVVTWVSSWQSKHADPAVQIDLIIEREDRITNICEMKYSQSEFEITKEYSDKLRYKLDVFAAETKTRRTLFLTLVTTYGVKAGLHSGVVRTELEMDSLFLPTRF